MTNKKPQFKVTDISVRSRVAGTNATSSRTKNNKTQSSLDDDTFEGPMNHQGIGKSVSKPKKRLTKKTKIIIAVIVTIIVIIIATLLYYFNRPKPSTTRTQIIAKTAQETVKPATTPSPLTGVEVDPNSAKQPVVAVVIENYYPDARPQSGLSSAGVVYEALAEGGITRYLAIFQDKLATSIGPVRSLRTYFIDWGLEYDAPVAHVGGNVDALALITPLKMKNLDQFYNGSYFKRVTSRSAPHNVYISDSSMNKLLSDRGFANLPTFKPWLRKDDIKSNNLTASTITINFSGADYQARFEYEPSNNSYRRFIRNTPDIDANDKVEVKPKNVVAMYMPTQFGSSKTGLITATMQTVGSGKAVVFMDGVATEATWKKASHEARTQFLDASGTEIKLNRGQTWISVVPIGKEVNYK